MRDAGWLPRQAVAAVGMAALGYTLNREPLASITPCAVANMAPHTRAIAPFLTRLTSP